VFATALGVLAVLLMLLRLFAADIYDVVIVWMTAKWYAAVFAKLRTGDRVLDVGIGTATALVKNKKAMLERRLSVVGIDYEAAYVRKAEAMCRAADLWRPVPEGTQGYRKGEYYCRVLEKSIYDPGLGSLCTDEEGARDPATVPDDQKFDAVYFSGSFTLMPNPIEALKAVVPLMKKGTGRIYITQTFNKRKSPVLSVIKPLMKYVTTIDFGQLTTEEDVNRIIADAGIFETEAYEKIEGSLDTPIQIARLIALKVKA